MSIEIKFRPWSKNLGRYIGGIAINQAGFLYGMDLGFEWTEENAEDYVIEQYTGLKDKNGKGIYEGDIVRCYSRKKLLGEYQVIWNEDCGGFECESLKPLVDGGDSMLRDVRVFNEMFIQFRVIGNIHENPELLD